MKKKEKEKKTHRGS